MDWTATEVELIIYDYFQMLTSELKGIAYNKTEHRKTLKPLLQKRSDGSIEFKHQNISAALVKNGLPYIKGYKRRWNYQTLLEDKVVEYVKNNYSLASNFDQFANQELRFEQPTVSFENWIVQPPELRLFHEPEVRYRTPVKRNYLEIEQKNKSIGESGELLSLAFERWTLKRNGYSALAKQVVWTSKEEGDGAGYDILSKYPDGSNKLIEVKSTTLGKETPIYFSKNEHDFSKDNAGKFHLYRVFDLKEKPRMFERKGLFEDFCHIEAVNFKGYF
ncbi:MAG: DUF3883 domain-containing protein [Bacteroidia bacterium]